jgi:hypothetical protein
MTTTEQRPRFYEHQYLEAADLTAVVSYSRAQNARHQLGAHRWGVALGLNLVEVAGPNSTLDVFVQPGYAWDGFGRPIVLSAPYKISGALFAAIDAEFVAGNPPRIVEVWLSYRETNTRAPRPGFEECDSTSAFARVVESFDVEVGPRTTAASQRSPIEIAGRTMDAAQALRAFDASAAELADSSVPHQTFPSETEPARWLVPIGVVSWEPGSPVGKFVARDAAALDRDARRRQYCGVVAGSIEATDGHVRVHDRGQSYSPFFTPDELLWVEGSLRVDGDARLYGHRIEFVRSHAETPRLPFHLLRRDDATGVKLQAVIGDQNAGTNRFAVGRKTGVDTTTNLDTHAEDFVVTDVGRVGIGTSQPKALLHLKEDGLQIGTSANPDDNFYIQSNTDGPRALRVYNKDVGAGTHLASFTGTGRVGLGTTDPTNVLHVQGDLGLRQNRLHLSGGTNNWSSIAFNAHRSVDGQSWVFPDPAAPAVTIEMDAAGGPPRFEVYSTLPGANTAWRSRLKVFGHSGDIGMAAPDGNVGIGTYAPTSKLDVNGEIAFAGGLRPVGAPDGVRVLWGRVNENGSIAEGTGFTVAHPSAGRYDITFTAAFPVAPAVLVTKVWMTFGSQGGTGVDTRENALVDQVLATGASVTTGDAAGNLTNSNFCFLAIGSR